MAATTPLSSSAIATLHRRTLVDPVQITALFDRVASSSVELRNGVDRKNRLRIAKLLRVDRSRLIATCDHLDPRGGGQLYFSFSLEGIKYFFATEVAGQGRKGEIALAMPAAVYEAERRDSLRVSAAEDDSSSRWVEMRLPSGSVHARVRDATYDGLGLELPVDAKPQLVPEFRIEFVDGARQGETVFAQIRHEHSDSRHLKVGVSFSAVKPGPPISVDRRASILGPQKALRRAWQRLALSKSAATVVPYRLSKRFGVRLEGPSVRVVDYEACSGQSIRAIVDVVGDPTGAPAIVIPPAWGRTKETLLPLARTLCQTFEAAGRSLVVVRFDGRNRRGESWVEPANRAQGSEYRGFRFSEAVDDIHATLSFLKSAPEFCTRDAALVTFSLAAIEGRRALSTDPTGLLRGWVAVVGMVDLQSGLKSVSGGVDYAFGLRRGVRFGLHELVGVVADMDLTGSDALEHNLVSFEDARRDMERITVPITWIHGRHDAWMELDRARELLSAGATTGRRLLEVPTGHQLRTSREAMETFQLVARETSRMVAGDELEPVLPSAADIESRRSAERARLDSQTVSLVAFWSDYLLGRDRTVGIELMTATSAYRTLMDRQIELLGLRGGDRVLDVGAGTGGFPLQLARTARTTSLQVVELDFVRDALARGQARLSALRSSVQSCPVVADLSGESAISIPLGDCSADAMLASLFLSYIGDPERFLAEARRVLRPGAPLVISCLRRDADISRIYVDGVKEVLSADRSSIGTDDDTSYASLQRQFLNDAAKILDLEEAGTFRFYEGPELGSLVRRAGFSRVSFESCFGSPHQAVVVKATRR